MWHQQSLQDVVHDLPPNVRDAWQWWKLPLPLQKPPHLSSIVEDDPRGVEWHSPSETSNLLSMMAPPNLARVREAQRCGIRRIGTIYRRTRNGIQRAEVRFDGISGCLRTPAGGSSRQIIMIVDGDRIRSRLISPRETARLMGIPDSYELPERYNDTYHLTGDGVVVPAVAWLERHIFRPIAVSLEKSTQVQRDEEPEFV
jgi:DNA (cytosine-5)-methyltransferase 1